MLHESTGKLYGRVDKAVFKFLNISDKVQQNLAIF